MSLKVKKITDKNFDLNNFTLFLKKIFCHTRLYATLLPHSGHNLIETEMVVCPSGQGAEALPGICFSS